MSANGIVMGKQYSQLTHENQVAISTLLRAGFTKQAIADQLGVHRSTIYRELQRNSTRSAGYLPIVAEERVRKRRLRGLKLNDDNGLSKTVISYLKEGWSPEQISGYLRLANNGKNVVSHETIYRWIYSDFGKRNRYYALLRRKRLWRVSRGTRKCRAVIPARVSITERPEVIGQRAEFGHWEGDLMLFTKAGTKTNLITLRERVSRFFVAILNPSKHSIETIRRIIEYFSGERKMTFGSITFDNGSEFFSHLDIVKALGAKTFFCDPYKSWQKGSVENGNGVLRVELPRTTPIDNLSQREINRLVTSINRRPMKCLGYRSPETVFNENISRLSGIL